MKNLLRISNLIVFSALTSAAYAGTPATVVTMTSSRMFAPARVQIHAGETVQWKNDSSMAHTVTADPTKARDPAASVLLPDGASAFDSGSIAPGATFEQVFAVPGLYRYFCIPHESHMIGEIEVLPAK